MKILFIIFLGIHGLIHLMGFAKAFEPAKLPSLPFKSIIPFSLQMTKVFGILWLLTAVLFLYTAFLIIQNQPHWGQTGLAAVLLSQILIIIYWNDARAGTIANLILFFPALFSLFALAFQKDTIAESKLLKENIRQFSPNALSLKDIEKLPPVVQKWLIHSNTIGKPLPQWVELNQRGEMLIKPKGKWLPFEAHQSFSIYPPGFVWEARIELIPGISIYGRDQYKNGHGNMLIKPLAMMTAADAKGKETDQGAQLRYLAEICWFPPAAISPGISWENISDSSAKAILHVGESTVSGVYTFSQAGDPIRFEALRYFENKGKFTLEKWLIESSHHKELNGIRIPVKSTVTWLPDTGRYTWLKLEISDIHYTYY